MAEVEIQSYEGDHFYLFDSIEELTSSIERHIARQLERLPRSVLWEPLAWKTVAEFKGVAQLFAEQALLRPQALALEDGERRWTYGQLAQASQRVGAQMLAAGVMPNESVGLLIGHRAEYLIGLLACFKVGAPACLLESNWSGSQLGEFIESCELRFLLSEAVLEDRLPSGVARLLLDSVVLTGPLSDSSPWTYVRRSAQDIAIISMTSGSTGRPKAVFTTEGGCTYCFQARNELYPYQSSPEREGLNVFFAWECLRPILFGQVAVIIPDSIIFDPPRLQAFLEKHRVNRLVVTPSLLENMLDSPGADRQFSRYWSTVRLCFLMGEVVSGMLVEKAKSLLPSSVRLVNAYSTWESLDVSYGDLFSNSPNRRLWATAGRVIPGSAAVVLDEQGVCVPQGVPGELYLTGPGVAPGYLGDLQRTAERFLPLTPELRSLAVGAEHMYRTGDRARVLGNGHLLVMGRIDDTIKIRGFKVSLLSIERVLLELEGVATAVVLPLLDERSGQPKALAAYLVGDAGKPSEPLLAKARQHLRRRLPEYARPRFVLGLDELPMRAGESRKLDRKALPIPDVSALDASPAGDLPALGKQIAAIWREILGINHLQSSDSFFELGGTSLLAAQLIAQLTDRLGLSLSVIDIYQHSTLDDFVTWSLQRHQPPPETRRLQRREPPGALAIVGMAGRFPGAGTLDEFWANLREGRDSLSRFNHETLRAKGVPEAVIGHPNWVSAGQVLDGVDQFDPLFWGIGQREATLMDPQHRLFMEVAWTAMEQAGYARFDSPYRKRTAVYAACGIDGYLIHHLQGGGLREPLDPGKLFLTEISNEKDYIATRVSYQLDLGGPGVTVTSACSSGLLAVAQAAQSLMSGECDMAIAGASAINFPNFGYCYEEGLVGSVDGRVHPFDEQASGTLFGDSVGAVVLKRLDDAIADGDLIWAVLSGYGMSNDGRQKAGYTAPNAAAQTRCIVDAMQMAGVSAEQISYVECHATATHIGDAIELKGLSDAFVQMREAAAVVPGSCMIGSVKGNIGHANCAAGITGLIKTVLCLYHRHWVPTAHYHECNAKLVPFLDNPDSPFSVCREDQAWPERGGARRAGVSSFGIGGTNVHVILEQAPAPSNTKTVASERNAREHHLLCVSAKSPKALESNLDNLAVALAHASPATLADAAFTLQLAREHHPLRTAVCINIHEPDPARTIRAAKEQASRVKAGHHATVAFCFSGQGSQHVGMAHQLYCGNADGGRFRRYFENACLALAKALGYNPQAAILHADEASLRRPVITQCGLFCVEYALAMSLIELGIKPIAVAGHSIGEYAAAVIAGALELDDAAKLVAARAQATEALDLVDEQGEPCTGGMLSVSGAESVFHAWLAEHPDLWLAVCNLSDQWVLAGLLPSLLEAERALRELGLECRRVPVSHPFHSALMSPVAERLRATATGVSARLPSIPMTSNVSGGWMGQDVLDRDYWSQHLLATVRWSDNLQTLLHWQPDVLLEIGPSTVLTGLARRFFRSRADTGAMTPTILAGMRPAQSDVSDEHIFCELLGRLWSAGVVVDWKAYQQDSGAGRIPLPTYAFDRQSYWVNPQASIYVKEGVARAPEHKPSPVLTSAWLIRQAPPHERAQMRLYCFSCAGGSSRDFRHWATSAPEWLDVVSIELPGRNARMEEPFPSDDKMDKAVRSELQRLIREDSAGLPFAFCGLSYGAAFATELLLGELADTDRSGQCKGLIVVGHAPIHNVSADTTALAPESLLMVSAETRANPLWQELYLPILTADLESDRRIGLRMSQVRGTERTLRCEVMVHCGEQDPACSLAEAEGWFELSAAPSSSVITYGGAHDFMVRDQTLIFERVVQWLQKHRRAAAQPSTLRLYGMRWQPLPVPTDAEADATAQACWTVEAGKEEQVLDDLGRHLRHDAAKVTLLYLSGPTNNTDREGRYGGFLRLLQQLVALDARGTLTWILPASADSGPCAGMARVAANESGMLRVQNLFWTEHPDLTLRLALASEVSHLAMLSARHPQERDLLWRGGCLFGARLASTTLPILSNGVMGATARHYLITGGSGALGRLLIDWLIDQQAVSPARITVLGRSHVESPLRGVRHIACDLSDSQALERALQDISQIDGIFHLAGVLDDAALANQDGVRLANVLRPKLALEQLMPHAVRWGCEWVIGYSSTSALLGAAGQANYAAANAWLDQKAEWSEGIPVFSLAWGSWGEAGMAADNAKVLQRARAVGETPLSSADALSALSSVLGQVLSGGAARRYIACDVAWQASPWADWPLLQQLSQQTVGMAPQHVAPSTGQDVPQPEGTVHDDPVRRFLEAYLSRWDESLDLASLGLDSLDTAQLRNGFNKAFQAELPLSLFANATLTLGELRRTLESSI